jgi:hypothetical protein
MMLWRRVLTLSLIAGVGCALTFWISAEIGIGIVPLAKGPTVFTGIWVCFWGSAVLGAVMPFITALAAWRYFSCAGLTKSNVRTLPHVDSSEGIPQFCHTQTPILRYEIGCLT